MLSMCLSGGGGDVMLKKKIFFLHIGEARCSVSVRHAAEWLGPCVRPCSWQVRVHTALLQCC